MEFFAIALVLIALIVSYKPVEVTIHHTYEQKLQPARPMTAEERENDPVEQERETQRAIYSALNEAIHGIGGDDGKE
jgi:hypothetical protein